MCCCVAVVMITTTEIKKENPSSQSILLLVLPLLQPPFTMLCDIPVMSTVVILYTITVFNAMITNVQSNYLIKAVSTEEGRECKKEGVRRCTR
jgi:hypothetical protein